MAMREFKEPSGKRWTVWNVFPTVAVSGQDAAALLNEDAAEGWLAFQSGREKRRFFRPPSDWESFTDEQLAFLCQHATVC